MVSNFKRQSVDLDSIFAPYVSGDKADVTGFEVGGVDLSDLYAPYISGDKAPLTGFTVEGVDLKDIFAPSGSPPTGVVDPLGFDGADYFAIKHGPTGATASVILHVNADGTWEIEKSVGSVIGLASGNWFLPTTGAVGAAYEVKVDVVETPDGFGTTDITNPAAAFVGLGTDRTIILEATYSGTDGDSTNLFAVDVTIRLTAGATVSEGSFEATVLVGGNGGA